MKGPEAHNGSVAPPARRMRLGMAILARMALAMALASAASLAVFASLYRHEITAERQAAPQRLGAFLQITLENAMLKRDLPGLTEVVRRLGTVEGVAGVDILSPDLEVRFSSDPKRQGQIAASLESLCPGCGLTPGKPGAASTFIDVDGRERLRAVSAVANREPCAGCHGTPATHPVNGFLVVDYRADDLKARAVRTAAVLAGAGLAVTMLALLVGYALLRRRVVQPVERLTRAAQSVLAGPDAAATEFAALTPGGGCGASGGSQDGGSADAAENPRSGAEPGAAATDDPAREDASSPVRRADAAAVDKSAAALAAGAAQGGDEIDALGRAFAQMSRRLAETLGDLNERDAFLQGVLDAIPDGVRVIRDDYSVVAANREFLRQSGLSFEEALAAPCYASSHQRKEPCVPTLVVCPLEALGECETSVRCLHAHARRGVKGDFPVEVTAAQLCVQTRDGPRRFVVEAIRDLTRSMSVSQEQRLSEIGQLATGVAHEIHNPLASIRFGLTALEAEIARKDSPDEALSYLKLVGDEVERCIDITGKLMRLSQSQSGPGSLIDLADVAHDVASLLSYESMTRRVDLAIHGFEDARVVASQADLGMALINLVQNAFHATPEFGLVALEGTTRDGRVIIEVSDSGCGIAPENLPRIFQPFWTHRADQTAGSGLGLPITKAIVEKWGGTISVRSRLGEGTTFTLSLPHAEASIRE